MGDVADGKRHGAVKVQKRVETERALRGKGELHLVPVVPRFRHADRRAHDAVVEPVIAQKRFHPLGLHRRLRFGGNVLPRTPAACAEMRTARRDARRMRADDVMNLGDEMSFDPAFGKSRPHRLSGDRIRHRERPLPGADFRRRRAEAAAVEALDFQCNVHRRLTSSAR